MEQQRAPRGLPGRKALQRARALVGGVVVLELDAEVGRHGGEVGRRGEGAGVVDHDRGGDGGADHLRRVAHVLQRGTRVVARRFVEEDALHGDVGAALRVRGPVGVLGDVCPQGAHGLGRVGGVHVADYAHVWEGVQARDPGDVV